MLAKQEIGESIPAYVTGKRVSTVFIVTCERVVLGLDVVHPESKMMPAANPVNVVGKLQCIDVEIAWSTGAATHIEIAADGEQQKIRHCRKHVHTQRPRVDVLGIGRAVVASSIDCPMKGVDERVA